MYFNKDNMTRQELDDGIVRYIYTGVNIQIVEYHFPANREFPMHSHQVEEQMGMVVSGTMGFEVNGEIRNLGPGEYYHAPVNTEHRAWTGEMPVVLVDIFSPPRRDL